MMLDRIVSKNIDPIVVIEVFLIQLGWILALGIPMAMLSATLMTFGRMAGDNEITAIKASGRSMASLVMPVMAAAAVVTVALFYFHDLILPESNHHAAKLLGDISRKRPAAFIEPGVLIRDFQNYTLYVDDVNSRTGDLAGIRILSDAPGSDPMVTVAARGNIRMTNDGKFLELSLYDGESHSIPRANEKDYFIARFQKQVIYIKNVDTRFERTSESNRGNREKNIAMMMEEVREIRTHNAKIDSQHNAVSDSINAIWAFAAARAAEAGDTLHSDTARLHSYLPVRMQNRARNYETEIHRLVTSRQNNDLLIAASMVEVHKKFAIPIACLIFVLIGAPLGIMARRGGLAVGASYSVFFYIMYWVFLIMGENWGSKLIVSPAVGMWSGNIFLAVCGIILMILMLRETTISFKFLKNIFGKSSSVFKRIADLWIFRLPGILFSIPRLLLNKICGTLPTYLIGTFLGYTLGLLIAIVVIFITIDYVSHLRRFENASYFQILQYYYYYLPWISTAILPIVLFLSSMFSMGKIAKMSELTAMKAAGVNVRQLTTPLLFAGLLLAGGIFYIGELIIPQANEQRALVQSNFSKTAVRGEQAPQRGIREYRRNFFYFAAPNIMYVFNEFCTEPQFFRGVRRYIFTYTGLAERIDAAAADFDDAGWRFENGLRRSFSESGMAAAAFETLPDDVLTAVPLDLAKRVRSKEAMSYWELASYIEAAKRRGEKVHRFTAELQFKIALPFMNFIVILFGLSLAARTGRRGGAALFGVGLLLSFSYWIMTRFALVFAQNGYIPIMVGAWVSNVFFFIIGLALYRKAAH